MSREPRNFNFREFHGRQTWRADFHAGRLAYRPRSTNAYIDQTAIQRHDPT